MTNEEFILQHREHHDLRALALSKMPEGIDRQWCLTQIEGWQTAKRKLPKWADTEGVVYPTRLAMEQCSSQLTAEYKQAIISRLLNELQSQDGNPPKGYSLTDITGGFGVDFSYIASQATTATYIEQKEELCQIAQHNFPLLGIPNAKVVNAKAENFLNILSTDSQADKSLLRVIYADPARRNEQGKKTVAIYNCQPNILELQDDLLPRHADLLILKLSPMLDITMALRSIKGVREVHIVSVKGECKELILVSQTSATTHHDIDIHCVNLATSQAPLIVKYNHLNETRVHYATEIEAGMTIIEPNASIMKMPAIADHFAQQFNLAKLHPQSHLYLSPQPIMQHEGDGVPVSLPAHQHLISAVYRDFSKATVRTLRSIPRAEITVRNFPLSAEQLRNKLKIKQGGDIHIFATTLNDNTHALIVTLAKY